MEPLKISDININNIVYTKIKKKQDYKIILMKYNNENFVFQTNVQLWKILMVFQSKLMEKYFMSSKIK